jgi:hypothetical protein
MEVSRGEGEEDDFEGDGDGDDEGAYGDDDENPDGYHKVDERAYDDNEASFRVSPAIHEGDDESQPGTVVDREASPVTEEGEGADALELLADDQQPGINAYSNVDSKANVPADSAGVVEVEDVASSMRPEVDAVSESESTSVPHRDRHVALDDDVTHAASPSPVPTYDAPVPTHANSADAPELIDASVLPPSASVEEADHVAAAGVKRRREEADLEEGVIASSAAEAEKASSAADALSPVAEAQPTLDDTSTSTITVPGCNWETTTDSGADDNVAAKRPRLGSEGGVNEGDAIDMPAGDLSETS